MIVITTAIEITIVIDIAMAVIKAVARAVIDTIAVVPKLCVSIVSCVSWFSIGYKIPIDVHVGSVAILIGSLKLPVILPQTTVCTANGHIVMLSSFGTTVQVTEVWLVVVGQLPQFDARMLYWITGQSGATGLQLKVSSLVKKPLLLKLRFLGDESGPTCNG